MRNFVTVVGILLIILGVATFAYKGIHYTTQEKIAQIGAVQVTSESQKTIYFPPILAGISLVAGVILVIVGRK